MNLGIRWKVALGTLAAVFVGLAVAGWLVIRSVEQTELSRMAETLETSSGLAAMTLRPLFDQSGSTVPGPLLHATVRDLSQQAHLRITVIRQDGTVVADSAVPTEGLTHVENSRGRKSRRHCDRAAGWISGPARPPENARIMSPACCQPRRRRSLAFPSSDSGFR